MATGLRVEEDVPAKADGCRHNYALREVIIDAVRTFWTTNPATNERNITRLESLRNRYAAAAGITAAEVTNKTLRRAVFSCIEERFGGTS